MDRGLAGLVLSALASLSRLFIGDGLMEYWCGYCAMMETCLFLLNIVDDS